MTDHDRHKISAVDIVAVLVAISLVGWFLFNRATPSLHSTKSLENAMMSNLRQISTAAQQYFLDKGVTIASYRDLVGTGTDNYIRNLSPVAGEDYTHMIFAQTATQLSISSATFGTITYNQ